MKREQPIIDERNYTVVGVNGYRRNNLTKEQAFEHASKLREEMLLVGWRGEVRVYYRDGTEVKQP